jgi:hypothetical protein
VAGSPAHEGEETFVMSALRWGATALFLAALIVQGARAADTAALLKQIKAIGTEGNGNTDAATAWKELAASAPEMLPVMLAGMDDAGVVASNWLRSAVDAVAEKALLSGKSLPAAELEAFVKDTKHKPAGRRIAYELLVKADRTAPERLLPGMLLDPGHELRRDAVALAIAAAAKALDADDKEAAAAAYRKALTGAVDQDQVDAITKQLKQLGVAVDLPAHFGMIRHWHLVTPFDNTEMAGFKVAYPPEKGVDLNAVYKGKKGDEVRWKPYTTTDDYGKVDLNQAAGKSKGAIAYAYAEVWSEAERPVQVRAGSFNAVKIFLNGKEIYARDEYHHGMRLDQHIGSGTLKKGRNEVLLKVCQNEQEEAWAQAWIFQVRLTDAVGQAVPFTQPKKE